MTENKLTVNSNSKETLNSVMFGESCDLSIPDGAKIVCVTAESAVTGIDAMNNELRIGIKTAFRAIYQNGENEFNVQECFAESVRSIVKEGIESGTRAVVNACVTDCEFTTANGGKAKATVEISGWFLRENTLGFLKSEMDGICCKTETIGVENLLLLKESGLTLTHSNEARMPLKRVLDCSSAVCINNVYPAVGMFQIDGELITKITAIADNGEFLCQTFSHSFSTEIGEEYCKADSAIDIDPMVKSTSVTLTDSDARVFIVDTELCFRVTLTEKFEIEGVVDCYSVDNQLEVESNTAKLDSCFCFRAVRDKASTVVKTDTVLNEVHCVVCPIVGSVNVSGGSGLTVEGLIQATVLYSDENNKCLAIGADVPFITEVAKDFECDTSLKPTVTVTSMTARMRTGSDIEVTAEFTVVVRGISERHVTLLSGIEVGESKEEEDYAISLYIVKPNESLWDVAKELNTDESTILRLNEDVKLPLKGGEKILIYKELIFSV